MNAERLACCNCGRECKVVRVDFGIGPYEYWGHRGVDVQERDCSDCCEADLTLYDESPLEEDERDDAIAKAQG
jgi:hypothetical protein